MSIVEWIKSLKILIWIKEAITAALKWLRIASEKIDEVQAAVDEVQDEVDEVVDKLGDSFDVDEEDPNKRAPV